MRIRRACLCSTMFSARINDRIRNDVASRMHSAAESTPRTIAMSEVALIRVTSSVARTGRQTIMSSNGEMPIRDDLETEITAGDMCIRGSYTPDHFVTARCQRWDQGDTNTARLERSECVSFLSTCFPLTSKCQIASFGKTSSHQLIAKALL